MRLRTFTAPDMQRAMVMIRDTMGDDAVIISTTRENGGKNVSVTAALDDEMHMHEEELPWENEAPADEYSPEEEDEGDALPAGGLAQYLAATAKSKQHQPAAARQKAKANPKPHKATEPLMSHEAILENRNLAYLLHELEQILTFHAVPQPLVEKMVRAARHLDPKFSRSENGIHDALVELLGKAYRFDPLELAVRHGEKAKRIMLVGPPGVGKTLAVAKIAADMVADELAIQVITIDNKRAGSVEQLRAFTHIMGLETEVAGTRTELRQLLRDCPDDVPVIIDSFGTNPYSFDELKELTDFANLHDIEPVLVLAAGGDAHEAADIAQSFCFLGLKRLLITRADTARRMGAVLSAADACNLALCNLTSNPQVAGGLMSLDAEAVSNVLISHKQDH